MSDIINNLRVILELRQLHERFFLFRWDICSVDWYKRKKTLMPQNWENTLLVLETEEVEHQRVHHSERLAKKSVKFEYKSF